MSVPPSSSSGIPEDDDLSLEEWREPTSRDAFNPLLLLAVACGAAVVAVLAFLVSGSGLDGSLTSSSLGVDEGTDDATRTPGPAVVPAPVETAGPAPGPDVTPTDPAAEPVVVSEAAEQGAVAGTRPLRVLEALEGEPTPTSSSSGGSIGAGVTAAPAGTSVPSDPSTDPLPTEPATPSTETTTAAPVETTTAAPVETTTAAPVETTTAAPVETTTAEPTDPGETPTP